MNDLTIYSFEGNEVRTLIQGGEPWFAGKDVCVVFGDTNHNRSLSRVSDDDKLSFLVDTSGGRQSIIFVNESGLYDLHSMQPQRAHHEGVRNEYPLEIQQALDEDEKGYTQMTTPGGLQQLAIVNEAGLYSLLFAMQPAKARGVSDDYIGQRQEKLKNFKRWEAMELELFKVKETAITHSDGHVTINKTTKVTGKGQQYFISLFLGERSGNGHV